MMIQDWLVNKYQNNKIKSSSMSGAFFKPKKLRLIKNN